MKKILLCSFLAFLFFIFPKFDSYASTYPLVYDDLSLAFCYSDSDNNICYYSNGPFSESEKFGYKIIDISNSLRVTFDSDFEFLDKYFTHGTFTFDNVISYDFIYFSESFKNAVKSIFDYDLSNPVLPPLVVNLKEVMTPVLSLVGLVVSCLVSWMALRKSWTWLLSQLLSL